MAIQWYEVLHKSIVSKYYEVALQQQIRKNNVGIFKSDRKQQSDGYEYINKLKTLQTNTEPAPFLKSVKNKNMPKVTQN